jgi:hypothetical protein
MILARDYLVYRRFAEWSADAMKKHDREVKKTRNKRLRIAKMKKPGLARVRKRKKQEE